MSLDDVTMCEEFSEFCCNEGLDESDQTESGFGISGIWAAAWEACLLTRVSSLRFEQNYRDILADPEEPEEDEV